MKTPALALLSLLLVGQATAVPVTVTFTGEITRYSQGQEGQGYRFFDVPDYVGTEVSGSLVFDLNGVTPRLDTPEHRLWDGAMLSVAGSLTWRDGTFTPSGGRTDDYVNVYNNYTGGSGFYDEWAVEDIWRPNCDGFCGSSYLGLLALSQTTTPSALTESLDPLELPNVELATRAFGHFGSYTTTRGFYDGFDSLFEITSLNIQVGKIDEPPTWALMILGSLALVIVRSRRRRLTALLA